MPAKKDSAESAKYLLYVKLLHDGTLSVEDKGAYEHMQTVYGYTPVEKLTVWDWWDTLRLELDCVSLDEFEMSAPAASRISWPAMEWPKGAFSAWQVAADSLVDSDDAWFARVMLRLHRADTSGLAEDVESAWGSLHTLLMHLVASRSV